ncbi:hypothetical protein Tco_0920731 [Tanacetum coccineum]
MCCRLSKTNPSRNHETNRNYCRSQVKSSDGNSSSSDISKLTHAVNQQTSAVTTAMTAILKQFQATPPPASVKAVEEICVTCGGVHPYYQCLAANGNPFSEYRDNIQGYVAAATSNYNQDNSGYRPPDDIFCQRCTFKSCGNDAHIGYNCPLKALIISNPEPCNNQTIDELLQTLPSFDPTCYSKKENSLPYVSKPNFVDDSPNVFNPPPQPPMYSCEFCGNDARYGHYCTPQVPFIYPEPCYNQDFNFPQDFHDFQQQYLCCENCGGPHETYQCQPMNEDYYHEQNSCYDPNSFGFDQFQPPQYTVNHPIFNAQNELLNSQNKIMEQMTSICDMVGQYMQKKEEDDTKEGKKKEN